MSRIKIIEKFQGQGLMRLMDEPWTKLIDLEDGLYTETTSSLEFITKGGLKIIADKEGCDETSELISYSGDMSQIGGGYIFVEKIKSKKDTYIIKGAYPGSFFLLFTTDPNYVTPLQLPFEIDDIQFLSDDHIRYENGKVAITSASDSQGHNKGANRGIQIESNISGQEGYTVTIFNMDGDHPIWGNNIQMAPKQMKLEAVDSQKIVLRGYGNDTMGSSFSDYGLTIYHEDNRPIKMRLHMFDRNVDIEYFKSNKVIKKEPEIIKLAKQATTYYQNGNSRDARGILIQLYRTAKSEPEQFEDVTQFEILGKAFIMMLDQDLSDDIDVLQMIVSTGYFCISKAIEQDSSNVNLYKDRLIILRMGLNPLKYTVMSALNLHSGGFLDMGSTDFKARDAIYKMEIADLELNPLLYKKVELFHERRKELDKMIKDNWFMPEKTKDNVIKTGQENHRKLTEYLENKIINECDVEF